MTDFDAWAYEETQRVIAENKDHFSPDAPIDIAAIFGGATLVAAIDPDSTPLCPQHLDCNRCIAEKYCWHKVLTREEREEILSIYEDADGFATSIDNLVSQVLMMNTPIRKQYEETDEQA